MSNEQFVIYIVYHDENNLYFNAMKMMFALHRHALNFHNGSLLKQRSADRHTALLGHIILK
jgi:hypothetical protein